MAARFLFIAILLMYNVAMADSGRAEVAGNGEPQLPAVKMAEYEELLKRLEAHVATLASPEFEGRGTAAGKALAINYLVRQFQSLKLEPLFPGQSYQQQIPGPSDKNGKRTTLGQNLGGWLRGADPVLCDEYVIISAHYDHLGVRDGKIYPGADDNASSVAMMLEVARRFAERPKPKRSLVFLSCDLEERLLWGSRWFAGHPPWPLERVKLFLTSEMIGRRLGDLPLETLFVLGAEHAAGAKELVARQRRPGNDDLAFLGVDIIGDRSDYGPFRAQKIPFLFFSGGEHPDYHKPTDLPDRIDYRRVARVVDLAHSVGTAVAQGECTPHWIEHPSHEIEEVVTLSKVVTRLLETDEAARAQGKPRLTDAQRFTVSNVRGRLNQLAERGRFEAEDRKWFVRTAQMLLLTVF